MRIIWQSENFLASYFENSWDKCNAEFLKTNPITNLHMFWKYLHHLVREAQESSIPGSPFSILLSDQFCYLTWKEFMGWRLQDSPIKNLHMFWKYLHHLVREAQESSIPGSPFSILLSDQFCYLTWKEFMGWRLQDSN